MIAEHDLIIEILKEKQPFASSSAGSPWEGRYPDVPGLGDAVFEGVGQLIQMKAKNPGTPCSGLVLGEAGSGKTHLIGRLFDYAQNKHQPYSCAYIQPIIDPHKAFRCLLREIVTCLVLERGHGVCQLDKIIAGIFTHVLKEMAKNTPTLLHVACKIQKNPINALKLKTAKKKEWIKATKSFLNNRHPDLAPEFVSVLVQYLFFSDRRNAAKNWLKGYAIDEDDLKLLNVHDRSGSDVAALENEAHEIIQSLDSLLVHYSRRPLVVFFDQLENLKTDDLVQKLCQLIYFLGDQCRTMLPVAFFREVEWKKEYAPRMNQSCVQRLEANQMHILGASKKQAVELVKSRLNHVLGETPRPDDLYPFYPDHKGAFDQIFTYGEIFPRRVLIRSKNLLQEIVTGKPFKQTDSIQILSDAFESRHQEILAQFNEHAPDEGRLTLALEQYLENRPENGAYGFANLEWSSAKVKYIDLRGDLIQGGQTVAETVFMVDVELHHRSAGASLDRGIHHLESKKNKGRALYIRDKRCKFPESWTVNHQKLETLRQLKGGAIFLNDKQAARWYALARLKQDVEAGDVSDYDGNMIGSDAYCRFVRERVNGEAFPSFKPIDAYFEGMPDFVDPIKDDIDTIKKKDEADCQLLCQTAMKILDQTSSKMMKAEFLAQRVEKDLKLNNPINADILLSAFNEAGKEDMFNFFGAPPGVIVQLRVKKYHDQS